MALNKFYGVRVEEAETSPADYRNSGIPIAFGTAPVHQVGGEANQIVVADSFDEAVSAMGWSDDWTKYTLCEAMYCQLKLYGYGPLVLVNVMDPDSYAVAADSATYAISDSQVILDADVIPDTVVVSDGSTTYEAGTDYDVFYEDGVCYVEVLEGGAIEEAGLTELTISYSVVEFEIADLVSEVIGGENATTGDATGLELMDLAYYKEQILPDIIIAPGFSIYPEVAAAMATKAQSFSTVFRAVAYVDISTEEATRYRTAVSYKESNEEYRMENEVVCWPMVKNDDLIYHLSTQMAALTTQTDSENDDVPSKAISNIEMEAEATCLADGTEILLDIDRANYLRSNGIVTAFNFVNGFTIWGTYAACYPDNTDPKDCMVHAKRMMVYVCNQIILRNWPKIDSRLTARTAEAIVDEVNIWINELKGDDHLLGGHCEFYQSENSYEDFSAGILHLHLFVGIPGVLQELDFTVEYDASYLKEAYESAFSN